MEAEPVQSSTNATTVAVAKITRERAWRPEMPNREVKNHQNSGCVLLQEDLDSLEAWEIKYLALCQTNFTFTVSAQVSAVSDLHPVPKM